MAWSMRQLREAQAKGDDELAYEIWYEMQHNAREDERLEAEEGDYDD